MKILYLEDDASLRRWTAEQIREEGYEVIDFSRVDQVKEYFNENMNDISIIITDLNMDDQWLGEYQQESYGGYFTGWVWLERFIYPKFPNFPTIIYSAYIDLLKEIKGSSQLEKNNIICVNKGESDNDCFSELIANIKKNTFN